MKRCVRFGDEEARLLAALGDRASSSFQSIAADLFGRVREHQDALAVLTSEAQLAELEKATVGWLTRFCGGTYDEHYFAESVRVGHLHARVGLPQRYICIAVSLLRLALCRVADSRMGTDAQRVREALGTLLDLELAAMLESYRDTFVAPMQRVDRLEREQDAHSHVGVAGAHEAAIELAHVMVARTEQTRRRERNAAVATLATGLAHEIRNPLNGAQLHVSYLKRLIPRVDTNREIVASVGIIGVEIQRLASLLTEFLDSVTPSRLVRKTLSVGSLCARSIELALPEARARHAVLRGDWPSDDIMIQGDATKLERVLVNLLRNAIEAVPEGLVGVITLRAWQQPRCVVFEVEDDGPGLARSDAPVFDAFFSTKSAGTGLGLTIAHRFVTDHGGTIEVESAPGRTIFCVRFPLDDLAHAPAGTDIAGGISTQ